MVDQIPPGFKARECPHFLSSAIYLAKFAIKITKSLSSVALCPQVSNTEAADLQVDFLHGYHGDGYPFDGAGGAVGHAFFPSDPARAGGVHLDAEEEWAFRQPGEPLTPLKLLQLQVHMHP